MSNLSQVPEFSSKLEVILSSLSDATNIIENISGTSDVLRQQLFFHEHGLGHIDLGSVTTEIQNILERVKQSKSLNDNVELWKSVESICLQNVVVDDARRDYEKLWNMLLPLCHHFDFQTVRQHIISIKKEIGTDWEYLCNSDILAYFVAGITEHNKTLDVSAFDALDVEMYLREFHKEDTQLWDSWKNSEDAYVRLSHHVCFDFYFVMMNHMYEVTY